MSQLESVLNSRGIKFDKIERWIRSVSEFDFQNLNAHIDILDASPTLSIFLSRLYYQL